MTAASIALFAATVLVSGKRPLWYDEVFSWTLVNDPSFGHMMYALRVAAESPPGLYHVLARLWLTATGHTVLSLRLFSTFAAVVALVTTWTTLRRVFSLRATALGVLTVFCTSAMMLFHSAEARFYPLFVACTSLALATYVRAAESDKLSVRLATVLLISNVALVQAHIYGVAYSAALLLALICCDVAERRLRPAVYACISVSWLTLLPWLPTLQLVNDATKPRHWIEPPTVSGIVEFYRLYSLELPFILLAVAALCLFARWRWAATNGHESAKRTTLVVAICVIAAIASLRSYPPMLDIALLGLLIALSGIPVLPATRGEISDSQISDFQISGPRIRRALLVAAILLLAAPPAAGVFSLLVKPVFIPKYVLPSMLGMAILLAWMADSAANFSLSGPAHALVKAGWAILLAALVAMPVISAVRQDVDQPPLYGVRNSDIAAVIPAGLPVAVENYHLFLPLRQQAFGTPVSYFYVGDPEAAASYAADSAALLHYRGAALWKDLGYLPAGSGGAAPEWHEFLARHEVFVVLHSPRHFWFDWRVRSNPEYTWHSLGMIGAHELLLVERRSPPRPVKPGRLLTQASLPALAKPQDATRTPPHTLPR